MVILSVVAVHGVVFNGNPVTQHDKGDRRVIVYLTVYVHGHYIVFIQANRKEDKIGLVINFRGLVIDVFGPMWGGYITLITNVIYIFLITIEGGSRDYETNGRHIDITVNTDSDVKILSL